MSTSFTNRNGVLHSKRKTGVYFLLTKHNEGEGYREAMTAEIELWIALAVVSVIGGAVLFSYQRRSKVTKEAGQLEKNELLYQVCKMSSDAVFLVGRGRQVFYTNQAARDLLSSASKGFGNDAEIFFLAEDKSTPLTLAQLVQKHRQESSTDRSIFRNVTVAENHDSDLLVEIQSVASTIKHQSYDIVIVRDRSCEKRLETIQYLNPISGLPNQYKAFGDITKLTAKNDENSGFAILVMELDNASSLRSSYGYVEMENILNTVSSVLREFQAQKNVLVYHLSYVTFMILVKRSGKNSQYLSMDNRPEKPEEIVELFARFQNSVQQKYDINKQKQRLSFSGGAAFYPHQKTLHDLLNHAYSALAHAQERGSGQLVLAEKQHQNRELEEEIRLNNEIREALKNGEFSLYFQPINTAGSHRLVGAETLIRWHHPQRGFIPPDLFIPVAERSGLIVEIGRYVTAEALKHLSSWNSFGFPPITLSINLSLRELETPDFISNLTELLYKYDIGASKLKLEITEHASMVNPEMTHLRLQEIRQLGIEISLDDFGTGYSSFAYLAEFPIRTLKVDKSFVQDLRENTQHRHIVNAIISLAHSLGMNIIAEGVETAEDAKLLYEMGADYLQGYYFSKPIPKLEFQYLLSHSADS